MICSYCPGLICPARVAQSHSTGSPCPSVTDVIACGMIARSNVSVLTPRRAS